MFTLEEYKSFERELTPILEDTYVSNPVEERIAQGDYFCIKGLWTNFENLIFFYDKQKLAKHRDKLLSICKRLPKFHQPCEEHAGTISSFDLLPMPEQLRAQSLEDTYYQMTISNHFANLVCGVGIANVSPVTDGENKAFLIVLDNAYRAYLV